MCMHVCVTSSCHRKINVMEYGVFHIRPEHTAYFYMAQSVCIDWSVYTYVCMYVCMFWYPPIHMSIVCHT
jgi:hypothetical protein